MMIKKLKLLPVALLFFSLAGSAAAPAGEQRRAGQAVWRADDSASGDFEFGNAGQAAASDNGKHVFIAPAGKRAALYQAVRTVCFHLPSVSCSDGLL